MPPKKFEAKIRKNKAKILNAIAYITNMEVLETKREIEKLFSAWQNPGLFDV